MHGSGRVLLHVPMEHAIFSSTASSLAVSHLRVGVGKVGLNLNVFGPNPVAHLLGNNCNHVSFFIKLSYS